MAVPWSNKLLSKTSHRTPEAQSLRAEETSSDASHEICHIIPRSQSGGERAAVQTLRDWRSWLSSAKRLECGGFSTAFCRPFALLKPLWLVLLLLPLSAVSAAAADKATILLVTGIDYPGHKWRETDPVLKRILEEDQRLDVRIVEDPHFLDSATLTNYAAVLLHFQNWEVPGPGVAARENLRRYVERGGGLMSVHFACGAWHGEWPEFQNIVGRVWHGSGPGKPQHDPRGPFTVRIVDKDHPVTRGLKDFETDDELYTCLTGDAPIHIVADAKSKVDSKDHPMGFVREYGKGRVFLTTLGHDVKAFTNSSVPQFIRQGCAWTAKLPPK